MVLIKFFGVCVVAGQSTPSLECQIALERSAAVTSHEDMPVAIGIVEVVPVGLAEMHVVVVYGQVKCSLLGIRREHDVVENDLIASFSPG
jgi:hypothetical protein